MKNYRVILLLTVALLSGSIANAQNNLGKADDIGRIVLSTYVDSNGEVPEYAAEVMKNKLRQIASKNGVAGNSADQRFVITANLIELTKDITPTAPPKVALTISPTLYIGDAVTGELYASCQLPNAKGVGDNDTKAYLNAIKAINANSSAVVECINEGKRKIIEYYNSQIDFILAEANSLMNSENYDEAMAKLAAVPTVCKEAYEKALGKIQEVYQKKIDVAGEKLYNEAYAQWNTAKTKESALRVVELLAEINPLSAAATKGRTLVQSVESHHSEIEAHRRAVEERNWAFKMKQYEDKHDIEVTKMGYDYDVQMEMAKNSGMKAEYALQEVKGIVSVMSNGQNSSSSSSSGSPIINNISTKVSSWFK